MDFTNVFSMYETVRQFKISPGDFFDRAIESAENKGDHAARNYCILEKHWIEACRPYYKVWPIIAQSFKKMPLDICMGDLGLNSRVIAIRFCKDDLPKCGDLYVQSILAENHSCEHCGSFGVGFSYYGICDGEKSCHWTSIAFNTDKEHATMKVDSCLATIKFATVEIDDKVCATTELAKLAARIAITVMLLANDPSIIEPDVLSKDRAEYNRTKDPERKRIIEERARRRGKIGWNIGEFYETMPHYRRPHFGIRHTGKGGTIPRIVPIKGAVVHRNKLTRVPTGYITPDGVEVEPE